MKRPALAVATAVLAAGALLTGCGSTHPAGGASGAGASRPSASDPGASKPSTSDPSASNAAQEAQQKYEQQQKQAVADHDRAFPTVAKTCAGKSTAVPSPVAPSPVDPTPSLGADAHVGQPENPKYAENHAYLQTVALSPVQQCRGDAHAALIAAGLVGKAPTGPEQAKELLTRLGYPGAVVTPGTGGVQFSVFVPQIGPCLTGTLSDPPRIEVHGPYVEGGCTPSKGGH
ncbi:hypothetical protein HUT16_34650 [Kitasatospora sp. NA04385]|uniref:hypothetical protein n=1 Tax=Kitasatospora sp. NA04385 TaxID=2742135 RepID=UPI0015917758|nr:hypothetical protein [Kitasatospora sp. NA04385]QKW23552.1 hypothetical protein HUT16_34650 [Kitasatospora sp. NA04385]